MQICLIYRWENNFLAANLQATVSLLQNEKGNENSQELKVFWVFQGITVQGVFK